MFPVLKLPKACFTAFENAVGELNILNVRFRLVMSLFEDGPCDYDVAVSLLDDLLEEYQRIRAEFSTVFNSLQSVQIFGALDS